MKPVKNVLLSVISVVLFNACFNQPEFSHSPTIQFQGISFENSPSGEDALVVSLSFKDGDGDLGFGQSLEDLDSPYHEINFFANDNGQLLALSSDLIQNFAGFAYKKTNKTPRESSYLIGPPPKVVGELITLKSRSEGFSILPPFASPYDCAANLESYLNARQDPDTVFIHRRYGNLIKDKSTIVDILVSQRDPSIYYFAVVDYFYININPYHHNFKVEFFIKNNDGSFTEYDFRKEFCETYDGRFPLLEDKERALEGIINYSMVSTGFLPTFSAKTLKLRVTIYDRALHSSNTIETPEFRLEDI